MVQSRISITPLLATALLALAPTSSAADGEPLAAGPLAERLAAALRFETVSPQDPVDFRAEPFVRLNDPVRSAASSGHPSHGAPPLRDRAPAARAHGAGALGQLWLRTRQSMADVTLRAAQSGLRAPDQRAGANARRRYTEDTQAAWEARPIANRW